MTLQLRFIYYCLIIVDVHQSINICIIINTRRIDTQFTNCGFETLMNEIKFLSLRIRLRYIFRSKCVYDMLTSQDRLKFIHLIIAPYFWLDMKIGTKFMHVRFI